MVAFNSKLFFLGMSIFLQNASFCSVYPEIISTLPFNEKIEIRNFIKQGIEDGFIKPLPKIVTSQKEFKKINEEDKKRKKIVISSDAINVRKKYLNIDSGCSYIILGNKKK